MYGFQSVIIIIQFKSEYSKCRFLDDMLHVPAGQLTSLHTFLRRGIRPAETRDGGADVVLRDVPDACLLEAVHAAAALQGECAEHDRAYLAIDNDAHGRLPFRADDLYPAAPAVYDACDMVVQFSVHTWLIGCLWFPCPQLKSLAISASSRFITKRPRALCRCRSIRMSLLISSSDS